MKINWVEVRASLLSSLNLAAGLAFVGVVGYSLAMTVVWIRERFDPPWPVLLAGVIVAAAITRQSLKGGERP